LIIFVGFLPVIATFRDTVADMAAVNGESMYPFLNDNKDQSLKRDWFLNWKWEATKGLERGMVVTFRLVSPLHVQPSAALWR
jgi:inner membrane protease subunit 2